MVTGSPVLSRKRYDREIEATSTRKTVDTPLDLQHWPGAAVDQHDVAPQPGLGVVVVGQPAVGVELRVDDGQRHVELALRQQVALGLVVHLILRVQAGVGILRGCTPWSWYHSVRAGWKFG
jgi:hypothetical protein